MGTVVALAPTSVSSNGPNPTPSTKLASLATTGTSQPSYRLLYRGALSLPDSELTLDGLAFVLRQRGVSTKTDANDHGILANPLALALETLRGRPSLKFLGTTKIRDVWLDEAGSGDIQMYIHPDSFLTRVYFDNILCLPPNLLEDGKTECGVRVGLGDDADKSEILIYGQASSTCSDNSQSLLAIRVSRILPGPRLPRPDDPTPRQPPLVQGKRPLLSLGTGESSAAKKRRKEKEEDETVRKAREVMLRMPKPGPSSSKVPSRSSSSRSTTKVQRGGDAVFKVPSVPAAARSNSQPYIQPIGKGKGKELPHGDESDSRKAVETEKANKMLVKTLTISHLSFAGVRKDHPDFKEVYRWVYGGAGFALREDMNTRPVDPGLVDKYVRAHVAMYVSQPVPTIPNDLLSEIDGDCMTRPP